jgi:hypothetical protein
MKCSDKTLNLTHKDALIKITLDLTNLKETRGTCVLPALRKRPSTLPLAVTIKVKYEANSSW